MVMARVKRIPKGKVMRPNFFVFCEGETEKTYVHFLRSIYRVPIQIRPKIADSNISQKYIDSCKQDIESTNRDKDFVFFDLDVSKMLEQLKGLRDVVLLLSNPCTELWYLLHNEECRGNISTDKCIKRLKRYFPLYEKGSLSMQEKRVLADNIPRAIERAKVLEEYDNPSTSVYRLIEFLEQERGR